MSTDKNPSPHEPSPESQAEITAGLLRPRLEKTKQKTLF